MWVSLLSLPADIYVKTVSLLYSDKLIKNNPTNMSALNNMIHLIIDKIIA